MGNCSVKAVDDASKDISAARMMTESGEILHLKTPKSVRQLRDEFPGYNVFVPGQMSSPLTDQDQLLAGNFYYLLPITAGVTDPPGNDVRASPGGGASDLEAGPAAKCSTTQGAKFLEGPRQSQGRPCLEVLPRRREGVWEVKFVIDSKQLGEILAEEENTEALIEQMRSAARISPTVNKGKKGNWGENLKVIFTSVLKVRSNENQNKVLALDSCSSSSSPT